MNHQRNGNNTKNIRESSIIADKKIDRKEIIKNLTGRTLMVYFVLLNKKSIGVRDLQRHLGLSSPSVAKYHLDKLEELNLVENVRGIFHLERKADIPALTSWVLFGKHLLPRVLFAAIFFSFLFISYLLFFYSFFSKDSLFVIIFGSTITVYTWIEVILQLKSKPI
ncbi:MAG: winged helix-turn-helix domain-containing protein [Promethearchaeota archaeon]